MPQHVSPLKGQKSKDWEAATYTPEEVLAFIKKVMLSCGLLSLTSVLAHHYLGENTAGIMVVIGSIGGLAWWFFAQTRMLTSIPPIFSKWAGFELFYGRRNRYFFLHEFIRYQGGKTLKKNIICAFFELFTVVCIFIGPLLILVVPLIIYRSF